MRNRITTNLKHRLAQVRLLFTCCLLLVACCLLDGCATMYNPATQKEELIFIDTSSEVFLGRNMDYRITQSYYIVKDIQINERVNVIGKKIARVSDRQDLIYHFRVIKDKEINAFATPGGYIYVHTGLLEKVNDDELAAVLAHEIGHVAARHIVKKLQAKIGYDILMSFAFGRGGPEDLQKAINVTFNLLSLGYSREDEYLADKLGIKYASKAGFDPQGMVNLLKKLQELEKNKAFATPLFLRSHPPLKDRIKRAQEEIANLNQEVSQNNPASGISVVVPKTTASPSPTPMVKPAPVKSESETQTPPQFSQSGLYKGCLQCGKTYPRSYQYCPGDGTKLKF